MESTKKFLHDRMVLGLVTLMSALVVIGVSVVLLRFDAAKSATTVTAYRQNVAATSLQTGKPIDIYIMAVFMLLISVAAVILSSKIYPIRRSVAVFLLGSTIFLLILATIVSNSLILKQ